MNSTYRADTHPQQVLDPAGPRPRTEPGTAVMETVRKCPKGEEKERNSDVAKHKGGAGQDPKQVEDLG